jgi:hypothetical protein
MQKFSSGEVGHGNLTPSWTLETLGALKAGRLEEWGIEECPF